MHADELIKNTYRWVLGHCVEWNWQSQQFSSMTSREFMEFVARTHTVVYRYVRGQQVLDGKCSDMECALAIEAKHVFGQHPA